MALFGPSDMLLGSHMQSICDAMDIPHLESRNDFEDNFREFSINLHPSQDLMNRAYKVRSGQAVGGRSTQLSLSFFRILSII